MAKKKKEIVPLLAYMNRGNIEIGVDEVGRGCLSGPVVAAAVVLPMDFDNPLIMDSKKLNEKKLEEAFEIIKRDAIAIGVGFKGNQRVDEINILQATFEAMHLAIDNCQRSCVPDHIIVDGDKFKQYKDLPHNTVIKGDGTYYSIAAASIIAKVTRDKWMKKLAEEYPGYGWETNVGYGSQKHRDAINELGVTPYHRMTFLGNIIKNKNKLF